MEKTPSEFPDYEERRKLEDKSYEHSLDSLRSFHSQIKSEWQKTLKQLETTQGTGLGTEVFDKSLKSLEKRFEKMNIIAEDFGADLKGVIGKVSEEKVLELEGMGKVIDEITTKARTRIDELKATQEETAFAAGGSMIVKSEGLGELFKTEIERLKGTIGTSLFDSDKLGNYQSQLNEMLSSISDNLDKIALKTEKTLLDEKNIEQWNKAKEVITSINNKLIAEKENIEANDAAIKEVTTSMTSWIDNIDDAVKKVPIIGDWLSKSMGFDKMKEELQNNLSAAFKDGKMSAAGFATAMTTTMKTMAAGITNVLKALVFNPWLLAIVGVALLIKMFVDLQGAAEDFRKESGLSNIANKELTENIQKSALGARKFGVELEDVYATTTELVQAFGIAGLVTAQLATDMATLAKVTGIPVKDLVQTLEMTTGIGGATKETAYNMMLIGAHAASTAKIPLVPFFEDIAASSDFVATYMGDAGKNIYKTAIGAKMLGVNMQQVAKMMETIMDFDTAIENELQASMLVGRQIDFNTARYMLFKGNIEGATKEMFRQIGSLQDFDDNTKTNIFGRKALAKVMGMEVGELRKSLMLREMIGANMGGQKDLLQAAYDELNGGVKLEKEQYLEQLKIQSSLTNIGNKFAQIGASLAVVLLPAVNAIAYAIDKVSGILSSIFEVIDFRLLMAGVLTDSWVSKLIKATIVIGGILIAMLAIKVTLAAMNSFAGKIGGGGAAGKGGGMFGSIFGKMNPVAMIKGAAAVVIMAGALWVLAQAIKVFADNPNLWESMGAAAVGLGILTLAIMGLGTLMSSGAGALAIIGGALAMGIMAGTLWLLGKAIDNFVPMVDTLLRGIANIAQTIGATVVNIINSVADSIVRISNIDALNLYAVAGGIFSLASALGLFAASSVIALPGLLALASLGPALMLTANAMRLISNPAVSATNVPNTRTLTEYSIVREDNNSPLISKIQELIDVVKNKNGDIYLDGKKVGAGIARSTQVSKMT